MAVKKKQCGCLVLPGNSPMRPAVEAGRVHLCHSLGINRTHQHQSTQESDHNLIKIGKTLTSPQSAGVETQAEKQSLGKGPELS